MIITMDSEWGVFYNAGVGDASGSQNALNEKDYARYTPTTVKLLTDTPVAGVALPADAVHGWIQVLNNPVSVRIGSTAATAAEGFVLPEGYLVKFSNSRQILERISFIDTSAGASEIRVIYGRQP